MQTKRLILDVALTLLVGSSAAGTLEAQLGDVSASIGQAQWIWLPADVESDMLLARKTFTLPEKPRRAILSITAGSEYQLFVNGSYISRGPARSASHHQSFDTLDITDALQKGKNVLTARVHFQREDVSYYSLSRAGLLAELSCTAGRQISTLATDSTWRVSPDPSWQEASPRMARFHLEVCDRVDLRRWIDGWAGIDFDDADWADARVLRRETGWPLPQPDDRPTHLIPPWTSLVARDIPYLTETVSAPRGSVYVGSVAASDIEDGSGRENWIDAAPVPRIPVPLESRSPEAARQIVVPANRSPERRVLVYDLGEVQNGRPFLDIAGPAGTVVDVVSAPYLVDHCVQSPIVMSTYVDRIVLCGKRQRWEAFYIKPARWLAVVFRHLPGEARVYGAGLLRSEYPFEQKGYFRAPDYPELEALWEAAAKTVRVCTTDAYTDNYRERRQYAQTAYYACLGNWPVFGDHTLQRRYLTQIAQEQLADGLMPAYAPRHGDDFMVILDSNCFWVRGLHQYLLYSGDRQTARELLPAARKLLDLLDGYTNADGLIDSPPQPYWLDHALNDRRGANFCLNGHYLGAVEDFAQLLEWLDEPNVDTFQQRAARMRRALGEKLWDPQRQLFADAIIGADRSAHFSEHANAMALALGIANAEQAKAIAAQLTLGESHDFIRRESDLVMVTPAMSYFLHAGLAEAGCADQSWDLLWSRFAHMLAPKTNGTLWEEWWLDATGRTGRLRPTASGRSDAQTESAFAPGLFSRYILGIEPTRPGLTEVVLRYYPASRLSRREGAIPTPSGLLEVAWDVRPAEFRITLSVPPEVTVKVDLARLESPTPQSIAIDGRPPSAAQLSDGFVNLTPGNYSLRIARR